MTLEVSFTFLRACSRASCVADDAGIIAPTALTPGCALPSAVSFGHDCTTHSVVVCETLRHTSMWGMSAVWFRTSDSHLARPSTGHSRRLVAASNPYMYMWAELCFNLQYAVSFHGEYGADMEITWRTYRDCSPQKWKLTHYYWPLTK